MLLEVDRTVAYVHPTGDIMNISCSEVSKDLSQIVINYVTWWNYFLFSAEVKEISMINVLKLEMSLL